MTNDYIGDCLIPLGHMIKTVVRTYPALRAHLRGRARWIAGIAIAPSAPDELKTVDAFYRQVVNRGKELYSGEITDDVFIDAMADIVSQQLTRAWNEGMRNNGLDPASDMQDEWAELRDDFILGQYDFVDGFAEEIVLAAAGEKEYNFENHASMWANRYSEMVSLSEITTAEDNWHYIWELGPTETHCTTEGSTVGCADLAGTVATAKEWRESGIDPQSDRLTCTGLHCQCSRPRTNKPLTGGIPGA